MGLLFIRGYLPETRGIEPEVTPRHRILMIRTQDTMSGNVGESQSLGVVV
eukprot:SAG25_NODE_845_length_5085_cov_16.777978_8_plen_50_part_00